MDIADRREFTGTLLDQLEGALSFFERYNAKEIKITGKPQHEVWEDFPAVSIREILVNALIHRDYFFDTSKIRAQMFCGKISAVTMQRVTDNRNRKL